MDEMKIDYLAKTMYEGIGMSETEFDRKVDETLRALDIIRSESRSDLEFADKFRKWFVNLEEEEQIVASIVVTKLVILGIKAKVMLKALKDLEEV